MHAGLLERTEVVELVVLHEVRLRAVTQHVHGPPRQHRDARRRALRVEHVDLLKSHGCLREGVEMRRGREGEAVRGEGLGSQRVGEEEDHVQRLRSSHARQKMDGYHDEPLHDDCTLSVRVASSVQ